MPWSSMYERMGQGLPAPPRHGPVVCRPLTDAAGMISTSPFPGGVTLLGPVAAEVRALSARDGSVEDEADAAEGACGVVHRASATAKRTTVTSTPAAHPAGTERQERDGGTVRTRVAASETLDAWESVAPTSL